MKIKDILQSDIQLIKVFYLDKTNLLNRINLRNTKCVISTKQA